MTNNIVRVSEQPASGQQGHGGAVLAGDMVGATSSDIAGGLVVAALSSTIASHSGKTSLVAALLRHWQDQGYQPQSYKVGPDYLDGKIHARVSGRPCYNLDGFAMTREQLRQLLAQTPHGQPRVIEGVMGLRDAARNGQASTLALAEMFSLPLLLVVRADEDPTAMASAVAALPTNIRPLALVVNPAASSAQRASNGAKTTPKNNPLAGRVIAQKIYQQQQAGWRAVWQASQATVPLIFLPPRQHFSLPHRHLGLRQADEWSRRQWRKIDEGLARLAHDAMTAPVFCSVDAAKNLVAGDGQQLWRNILTASLARPPAMVRRYHEHDHVHRAAAVAAALFITPWKRFFLARQAPWRLAVARDLAFGFIYPHQLVRWRRQGLAVDFFSPLADDAPNRRADGLFLPGGYPELYLPALARARHFRRGVAQLAARNKIVYGECGGYMMLGRSITNAAGRAYPALDLLPVSTSFAAPRLTLGYRVMEPQQRHLSIAQQHFLRQVMGDGAMTLQGHEFHYCTERMADQPTRPLFRAFDANHQPLPSLGGESMAGAVHGSVMGSFLHVI